MEDELRLILAPGHAWANLCIEARDLLSQPLIARKDASATDEVLREALESAGVSSHPTLVLSTTEAVKNAVANDLGWRSFQAARSSTSLLTGASLRRGWLGSRSGAHFSSRTARVVG